MEEYTFRAIAENGMVSLPGEYTNKIVEITVREVKKPPSRKRDLLSPVKIDTKDWKWSREEANERQPSLP